MLSTALLSAVASCLVAGSTLAPNFFSERVAPVLEYRCLHCHNDGERKGGLSLQSAAALEKGGESGAVIKPGDAAASPILDMVVGDKPEMPKNGKPLTAEEIDAIRQWINAGAKWPDGITLRDRQVPDNDWWSLKPIHSPPLPNLPAKLSRWIRTPIDTFVLAKLHEQGLSPSPEADRRTLIRRLTFDLIGLPPNPEEVDAFVRDQDPKAYEKLVDRLLDSPHYGERWARHWLDVVHYGDTHGYDKDKLRPNAWPYRDYVIRAFNDDRPYSRFVQEQLAGDVLWPETLDGQVATGFIAAGPWDFIGHAEVPESKIDGKIARHLDRDDMVATTMNTFVSFTVQCAQCHNHKFDPVAQENYYSLQAVFAALDRADRPYETDPAVGRQRRELLARQKQLNAERKKRDDEIKSRTGGALEVLDRQLADLNRQQQAKEERPEYGYHSQIEPTADHEKWVQVDLGKPTDIENILYVGCWDAFNNIFHGFGFPVRYRIQVSNDPEFKTAEIVVDRMAQDEPNPGTKPQTAKVGKQARYIRVTATKLAPRQNDFIFALGELQVFDGAGVNVAFEKPVTARDSIEAPVRWARSNLVDGYYYGVKSDPNAREAITRLSLQRQKLIDRVMTPELRDQIAADQSGLQHVQNELAKLPAQGIVYCGCIHTGNGTFIGTGANGGKPRDVRVLERGNVQKPGELVGPGAIPIIPGVSWQFALSEGHSEGDRRVALANWIIHHDNPLTWRSIVNRVWQYHFGRGIVDSPNDFGRMGQQPTHPELLDWLAADFRDGKQSIKDLHRLIVNSATYRQNSGMRNAELGERNKKETTIPHFESRTPHSVDSENRYLWRMNRRKLEAEAIRDSVLFVAGKLDRTMYGPAFQDFVIEKPEHSPHYEYGQYNPDDTRTQRRSIYRFLVRSQPQPFMNTLDCADPSQLVDKRNETLTALQALALLNNRFMVRMSEHFAARLKAQDPDLKEEIVAAFRIAISREPTGEELQATADYATQFGLANACRVIMNLNEFAFID